VSRALEDYLAYAEHSGVTELLRRAVRRARAEAEISDREEVAAHVRQLIRDSGLTAATFASRAGTSASRLSTYASGKVIPSAAMMLRLERVGQ
jgi:transcriptional regulator with XRE-family HTH domain